uniref:Cadherin domain-containing protein n=1 Tax=Magallana gigas TaxID=29159 RepID=A0A8W8L0V3_MAGGI|nr:mucin-3A-like [Crassostrea gigas]
MKPSLINLLFWMLCINYIDCQCTTNTVGKIPKPPDDTDHGTNRTFLLYNDQQTYEINCCGYISQWETDARYTGDLYAQIWRSVGGNWSLIGENNLTISATGSKIFAITLSEQIAVEANDVVGFKSPGLTVPNSKKKNGGNSFSVLYKDGSMASIGDTESFSNYVEDMVTDVDKTEFAIMPTVGPGSSPSFSTTPTTNTITDDSPIGTLVLSVNVTDVDPGDSVVVSLSTIVPSSSAFSFNATSMELQTTSALTFGAFQFTFTATDHCGNTATHTLDLTVHNPPPVIHNLPAGSSINENSKTESQLYTINVTDDSANDAITCYIQKTTPQIADFYIRRTSLDTYEYSIYLGSNANSHLDYDTAPSIDLNTCCTDAKVSVCSNYTVTLIKNHPPVISSLPATAVDVYIGSVEGTPVYTVATTDPESDSMTYEITCNNSCPFRVSENGEILVNGSLSGLNGTDYNVSIFVFDGKNNVGPENITLSISGTEPATTTTTTAASVQAATDGVDSNTLSAIYTVAGISAVTCCSVIGVGLLALKIYRNVNRQIKPSIGD